MSKLKIFFSILLLLIPVFLLSACTNNKSDFNKNNSSDSQNQQALNDTNNSDKDPRYIIMTGRSVMNGWFQHWGWDGESPMQLERYTIEYRELSSPPDIAASVRSIMQELPDEKKDVIFFKLCFEDFLGDTEASDNLQRNQKIIQDVHQIVVEEHEAELILGNALPKVIGETDIYLVWNHQQFISWLNEFWRENPGNLTVFDMYNPITNDLGALKESYAVSPNDSHLNDLAYDLLDSKFFDMLDAIY
jgi:hypothetical protein